MLTNKIFRTIKLYRAQFVAMVIMITFGVGIFVGFNIEWTSLEKNLDRFFAETNQADYYVYTDDFFSKKDLNKLKETDFVESATRSIVVEAQVADRPGSYLAIVSQENLDVSGFILGNGGRPYDSMLKDGIWLSDKYAAANNYSIGDTINLKYNEYEMKGTIAGLIKSPEYLLCLRDDDQAMPNYKAYGYAYVAPKLIADTLGTTYFYNRINVISGCDKSTFRSNLKDVLDKDVMVVAKEDTLSYQGAEQQINEGKIIGNFLPVLFFAIAVLTMITTMNRITAKEKTQIGTLKALGFKNRKIIAHYTSYSIFVGIIGITLGIGLSFIIAYVILNPHGTMATYFDMPYWTLGLSRTIIPFLIGLILLLIIVGIYSIRKVLKGNAAQVLRPYTPKVVKSTLADRLPLFSNSKFGTKWNLRDIARNKTRTLMSFIGVAGCVMMLVSAVGFKDTMNKYVEVFYGDAMNYSTKISLEEGVSNRDARKIAEQYKGDYSSSISIEIEDDAASLDVFRLNSNDANDNKVKFIDCNGKFIELNNDSALVCRRLADKFDIKRGDKLHFKLYGTSDEYEVSVAAITQSLSKNIVITTDYAEQLDISYSIDSVYTGDTEKNIAADKKIRTLQSKQSIVDSFSVYMDLINLLIIVLLITSVVLGITVLYNLGMMGYTERYKDMATLKVLGFKDRVISGILVNQNMWITLVGILAGFPCGYYALDILIKKLGDEFEMNAYIGMRTYAISVSVTFAVSLIVALLVARKNKEIDMVEAMKGSE